MDRKSIIVIGLSVAFIIAWVTVIVPKYLTPAPRPQSTNTVATLGTNGSPATPAAQAPATLSASTNVPVPFVASGTAEETLVLTNAMARYTFTSHGGGLKRIELVYFPESHMPGMKLDTNRVATLNTKVSVPVMALVGDAALQGDGIYTLSRTEKGVRAEKALPGGLIVVKDFEPTANYLVQVKTWIENPTDHAIALPAQSWIVGTATPIHPLPSSTDVVGVRWFDGAKPQDASQAWFDNKTLGCFPGTPRTEYRGGASNVVWVSSHNQFFAMVVIPSTNAPEVVIHSVKLPKPTLDELPPKSTIPIEPPVGLQSALYYPATTLAAGATLEQAFKIYAGPKESRILNNINADLNNQLDHVMGFGFFGIISKVLLLGMNWLHDMLGLGYGWAIVVITVIIKLVFWPLTAASTRSMKRMSALQPQMNALKEKYKDDAAKMNKKLMEFMKENKVNPMGGCLPMLLQIPVFFGFFSMIGSAVELRGAPFLWCADISMPDTLFMIPGLDMPFNLLPLIMGATMFWQAQLTPLSPGMDPMQQKIMKYLPLMFMVFLYNYSAALTVYWTTNNLLTILQTKLTKMKDVAAPVKAVAPVKAAAPAAKRK